MKAVDSNVLISAFMEESPHHATARRLLEELASTAALWAIPWPCIYEFLRVVTHPRVFHPPMAAQEALAGFLRLAECPSLVLLGETGRHAAVLSETLRQSGATGNLVHDAHIAALCVEHGIRELITGDRDFHRFRMLSVVNPFEG